MLERTLKIIQFHPLPWAETGKKSINMQSPLECAWFSDFSNSAAPKCGKPPFLAGLAWLKEQPGNVGGMRVVITKASSTKAKIQVFQRFQPLFPKWFWQVSYRTPVSDQQSHEQSHQSRAMKHRMKISGFHSLLLFTSPASWLSPDQRRAKWTQHWWEIHYFLSFN